MDQINIKQDERAAKLCYNYLVYIGLVTINDWVPRHLGLRIFFILLILVTGPFTFSAEQEPVVKDDFVPLRTRLPLSYILARSRRILSLYRI